MENKNAPIQTPHSYDFKPIQNPILAKKLSDYHFSRIIPNFYLDIPYKWKYSPYIYSSRLMFTFIGGYILYRLYYLGSVKKDTNTVKKYHFNIYTKPYIKYENALIKSEKNQSKIIF